MLGELTPEYARTVELPLNPFRRHRIVAEMLDDPRFVGDVQVVTNPTHAVETSENSTTLIGYTVFPFLGRRTLKKTAQALVFIENNNSY